MKFRYSPARLAISRSLSETSTPPHAEDDEGGKVIKGSELFGDDLPVWISLIVQHHGSCIASLKDLQVLVVNHWHRGALLLWDDWKNQREDFDRFLLLLATRAGIKEGPGTQVQEYFHVDKFSGVPSPITLRIGDPGIDIVTKKPVDWISNAPGVAPHVALMGGTNSGKTYLALNLLRQIKKQANCPILFFDIAKGDIAEKTHLISPLGIRKVCIPGDPVPLNFLALEGRDAEEAGQVALAFRDSFEKVSKIGAVQKDILRDAVIQALQGSPPITLNDVRDAVQHVCEEQGVRGGTLSSVLNDLCIGRSLFFPELSPQEFFSKSWLVDLHNATDTQQKLVVFLILDAAKRYFMGLPDAPTDESGHRGYRAIIAIDEARRVLGYKHPSLSNLIRLARSKGVGIWLMSQSPDDFDQEEDEFLANIGLTISFKTNASRIRTLKNILGTDIDLAALPPGVVVTRLSGKNCIKVQAWEQ